MTCCVMFSSETGAETSVKSATDVSTTDAGEGDSGSTTGDEETGTTSPPCIF